jgi:alkylation response protein AidB-like acyl-CoA dehydrogenase
VDLTLNAEQQALRSGIRDYLADRWDADRLRAAVDEPALRADGWKELAELGVFGLMVPEEAGGLGLALADAAIVAEELGAALVPGPVVPTMLAAGLVDGALDGDAVVTMLDTTAPRPVVEHPDIATHVVEVDAAGLFLASVSELAARLAPVPLDPLTPVAVVEGTVVEGTLQPHGPRIGTAGDALAWRLRGTVLSSAFQVGVARGGLDLAVRYAGERVQFGRVVGGFQAVKHLLAESLVRVELARAAVLSAAVLADDPQAGDPSEAAAAAKVLADDAASAGGRTCVQVHGGMGFTWEVLAHLYLKRAWVLETAFGPADEHAVFLAERLAAGRG